MKNDHAELQKLSLSTAQSASQLPTPSPPRAGRTRNSHPPSSPPSCGSSRRRGRLACSRPASHRRGSHRPALSSRLIASPQTQHALSPRVAQFASQRSAPSRTSQRPPQPRLLSPASSRSSRWTRRPRSLRDHAEPPFLSIFTFGESENKELRQRVKKPFNTTRLETIIFMTSVESVSVPFIEGAASRCGPLVKGKESVMNLCSL